MVKDVPIPKEIFQEFEPFVKDKEKLVKLFDNFDLGVLCDKIEIGKEMPSHSKGQNCLDKYFSKVNLKDSSNCFGEMGKKNTKLNEVHKMSSSSGSETEVVSVHQTRPVYSLGDDDDDMNCKENIEFERTPSTPIIAAMNALGKLKREISVLQDDNSSRDSTALVIDEEQIDSEKEPTASQDEMVGQCKSSSKSPSSVLPNNEVASSKDTTSRNASGKANVSITNKNDNSKANDSLSISQFFNVTKTTSTPVDNSKGSKRKLSETSPERSLSKKAKERKLDSESETWSEAGVENMTEVNPLRDGSCPLFLEDLNSDDEVYVVQCPKDVEAGSLIGKQLELDGESILNLEVNKEKRTFECYSQKDSMERHVNIILPSKSEGVFKFGIHQLKGSIVISESLDAPEIETDDEETLKPVSPEVSEDKVPTQSCEETIGIKKQKHKKHSAVAGNTGEVSVTSPNEGVKKKEDSYYTEISSKKLKKERGKEEELSIEQAIPSEQPIKRKKKKKHYDETERLEEPEVLPEEAQEMIPIKKKKKKKDKEIVNESEPIKDEIPTIEPEALEVQPVKKKKKKKHQKLSFAEQLPDIQEYEGSVDEKYNLQVEDHTVYSNVEPENSSSHPKFSNILDEDIPSKKKKKKKKKKAKDILSE